MKREKGNADEKKSHGKFEEKESSQNTNHVE